MTAAVQQNLFEAREDRWASENEPVDDGYGEDHGGY